MKHVLSYVIPNQTAKTIIKYLYQGYILIFGAPTRLLSDRGATFMSSVINEMYKILGVKNQEAGQRQKKLTGQGTWLK